MRRPEYRKYRIRGLLRAEQAPPLRGTDGLAITGVGAELVRPVSDDFAAMHARPGTHVAKRSRSELPPGLGQGRAHI